MVLHVCVVGDIFAQSLRMYGLQGLDARMSLRYFLGLGLLNFSGAAICTARVPERWYPKRFDVWGLVTKSCIYLCSTEY